jgi:NADH:ubiquinone oxidoreductase subunit 5 (subunit L)/multisubunit Na+/H+ antiporter MnhA subunit
MLFSLLNLAGAPFFFGFYIKHFLFMNADYLYFKIFCTFLIFCSALSGVFYSFKIVNYVFFDIKKAKKSVYLSYTHNKYESRFYTNSNWAGNIAIFMLLLTASCVTGYLFSVFIIDFEITPEVQEVKFLSHEFNFLSLNYSQLFDFTFLAIIILVLLFTLILIS